MNRIGAFFDFDKTLLETESAKLGFQYLWERRMISFGFLLKISIANFFYQRHLVSDEFMGGIILKFYQGKKLEEFAKGAPLFYRQYLRPRLAPNILSKVREHQKKRPCFDFDFRIRPLSVGAGH